MWTNAAYTLSAQDAVSVSSGVKEIWYRIQSGAWVTVPFDTSSNPTATVQAEVAGLPEGGASLEYYVVDVAGNKSTTVTDWLWIDRVPPVVTVSQQSTNADGSVVVRIASTNNGVGTGVDRCWYEYTDGTGAVRTGVFSGVGATNITLAAPASGSAEASVTAYARDYAGNQSSPTTLRLTLTAPVDLLLPTTLSDALPSYTVAPDQATVITLTPSDTGGSGIQATYYELDGGPQTFGTSITVPAPVAGLESHTLRFWSVDNAGNVEPVQTADFTIETL